jgi:hypothetical protein
MARTLQDVTDAWGNWMNSKYSGGGIRFTESTKYSNRSELNQYHRYETMATYQSIVYDNGPEPINGSARSIKTDYRNNTSLEQSVVYKESMTMEQSFTWSMTESLSIGIEMSATVGVPKVAESSMKVTTTLSLSSTQGSTSKKTQTWAIEQPLRIPPRTHVNAQLVVGTQDYDINWTATCKLEGYVAIWFNNKVALNPDPDDKHWLWFYPIEAVIDECRRYGIIDTAGYQVCYGSVLAQSRGKFSGGQGINMKIDVNEEPLEYGGQPNEYVVYPGVVSAGYCE